MVFLFVCGFFGFLVGFWFFFFVVVVLKKKQLRNFYRPQLCLSFLTFMAVFSNPALKLSKCSYFYPRNKRKEGDLLG